jgi:hypothetical protein
VRCFPATSQGGVSTGDLKALALRHGAPNFLEMENDFSVCPLSENRGCSTVLTCGERVQVQPGFKGAGHEGKDRSGGTPEHCAEQQPLGRGLGSCPKR